MPGCSNTQGIKRNIKMNKTLLSIIPATVNIVKLLPVFFLFTWFQAHAAPITTIGNLSYDGTLITGDGRTYLGFDTLASLTYQETVNITAPGMLYEDYRIANNSDVDFFISSIFGGNNIKCSLSDGVATNESCGNITDWNGDGSLGENHNSIKDVLWYLNEESDVEVGLMRIGSGNELYKADINRSIEDSDVHSNAGSNTPISWLLVNDAATANNVPAPSSFAIFVLGLAGIRFVRRRRS
jgi:hypothetical protein